MTDSFILDIIEKFNSSSVVALDLAQGSDSISLKKAEGVGAGSAEDARRPASPAKPAVSAAAPAPAVSVQTSAAADGAAVSASASVQKTAEASADTEIVKSPLVGTFFRSAAPDSPAYVEKGKQIKKGDPLCILEAMKMMNTLESEFDCEIVDILAANGDLVEYDQPLFAVKRL